MYYDRYGELSFNGGELFSFMAWSGLAVVLSLFLIRMSDVAFGVLTPMMLWMVFFPRPQYLFFMILMMGIGSQHHYVVLLACMIYCFLKFDRIMAKGLGLIFLFYALMFPFFLWLAIYRVKSGQLPEMGERVGTFSGALQCLSEYLFLAPFFWAAISFRQLPKQFFKLFSVFAMILGLVHMLRTNPEGYYNLGQYEFWILGYLGGYAAVQVLCKRVRNKIMCMILAIFFIIFFYSLFFRNTSVTFTQLALVVFSGGLVFVAIWFKAALRFIFPTVFMSLAALYVWGSEARMEAYAGKYTGTGMESYERLSMTSWEAVVERVQRKAIDDRATLWAANVKKIKSNFSRGVFYFDKIATSYELESIKDFGRIVYETIMPAHNVFLQLGREYGIYGFYLFAILVWLVSKRHCFMYLLTHCGENYLPIAAASISFCIIGTVFGHAALGHSLSFLLFGMLGVSYSWSVEVSRTPWLQYRWKI